MNDWTIGRRQPACGSCQTAYSDGERHVSVLSILGDSLAREDLCESCWTKKSLTDAIYFWFTRHSADRRRLKLDLATLEDLFLRLESRRESTLLEIRYLLCLLLMRKKRIKLERITRDADGECMIVRRPRREEALRVSIFDFSSERVELLRGELARVLDGLGSGVGEALTATGAAGTESSDEDAAGSRADDPAALGAVV